MNEKVIKGKDYIGVGGGCLILNDKKEVLLIRRAGKARNETGWWSKPGGTVSYGEAVKSTMIREMKEELNIDVKIIGYLPHTDHIIDKKSNNENQHWVAFNLIAEIIKGEPKNMEPHKCDKIGWFVIDKLPAKITQTTKESIENYLARKYINV